MARDVPEYNQPVADAIRNAPEQGDPALNIPGMPPNYGRTILPQVMTLQGLVSTISRVYRPSDEAIRNSLQNARYMLNDCGVMECIEQRQRATALLDWELEPEDKNSEEQKNLCTEMTAMLNRIPRFMQFRENNLSAIWWGRFGVQSRYQWVRVGNRDRVIPTEWKPINGDKLVFRLDDGKRPLQQRIVGIRVGQTYNIFDRIGGEYDVEPTDRGMAYFLAPWERKLLSLHRHMITDGAYESPEEADKINGVGIRSKIYWDWFQKQELLAFLVEYLERSAFGIELWYYPSGNPQAKQEVEVAAQNRLGAGKNVILVPRPAGEDAMQFGVEHVEPGLGGIEALQNLLVSYYGHRIKRYILGQTLTSEVEATGIGGDAIANVHLGTFMDIIRYDARNLEETISDDVIRPMKEWNFPNASHFVVKFRIKTESPNVKEKLESLQTAWEMNARIREQDVYEAVGASAPTDDDKVLPGPSGGMPGQEMSPNGRLPQAQPIKADGGLAETLKDRFGEAPGKMPSPMEGFHLNGKNGKASAV